MVLEGIHHVTAITADAPGNFDFYTRVLGLRLVKKTVNQDDPTVYHLFYGDDQGNPGFDLTFFEYPGMGPGHIGAGMVARVSFRVASIASLDFWDKRLTTEGISLIHAPDYLRFEDPEGLRLELSVADGRDRPLVAQSSGIPPDMALQGFAGVVAYSMDPAGSRTFLEQTLGFRPLDPLSYESRGADRGNTYTYEQNSESGSGGAGTVHHVAWASRSEDHQSWQQRILDSGARPTPIIDRYYFRSIYFREPSGVLFEIATIGPGFGVDEPLDSLGERLALPPKFEHMRDQLEASLTPLQGGASRP